MRRNAAPRPRPHDVRGRAPDQKPATGRKIFYCIVDETALIDGVKPTTRDGIRKWVAQGAIRLYVPLHTLAQLDVLKKKSTERTSSDARAAILWLDDVTSDPSIGDRVQLEGVDEALTWPEVEHFMLPETLLHLEDTESEMDTDSSEEMENLENSMPHLDISDGTSLSSAHTIDELPKSPVSKASACSDDDYIMRNSRKNLEKQALSDRRSQAAELARAERSARVPVALRPLFNHVLWRIHQEVHPFSSMESFIFLTNDPEKQQIAQRFGIRAKRLEQLRDAVLREDREMRNRQILNKIESAEPKTPAVIEETPKDDDTPIQTPSSDASDEGDSDEDVVLFKGAPRGPKAQVQAENQAQTTTEQPVLDPNDFGRANPVNAANPTNPTNPGNPVNTVGQQRGGRGGRGRGGFMGPPRGRGGSVRGRGGFMGRGAYRPPVPPFRPPPPPRPVPDANTILNPDSFERPSPRTNTVRGGRRRLWEPN